MSGMRDAGERKLWTACSSETEPGWSGFYPQLFPFQRQHKGNGETGRTLLPNNEEQDGWPHTKSKKTSKLKTMNWKTIFNPFEKFDEKYLLAVGFVSFFAIILVNKCSGSYFTSIYRIDHIQGVTFQQALIKTSISYISMIAVLFLLRILLFN